MKKFEELMSVSSEIESITAEDAKKKINDPNVQFIDVRDKESFSKGTIGNAVHLDRGLLEFYFCVYSTSHCCNLEHKKANSQLVWKNQWIIFRSLHLLHINRIEIYLRDIIPLSGLNDKSKGGI